MSKPTLALIPSGYKSGKVYSILPNDASGDFDFTRQSIGTRVRKDGLIEEAKTVGSITNLQIRSEEFDNSAWIKSDISVTANDTLAPNGTNTADAIVEGTGTGGKIIYDTHTTTTGIYTFSVHIKKEDKRYTAIQVSGSTTTSMFNVDLDNGTGEIVAGSLNETNIETLANDWYRVSITFSASSGTLNTTIYLMNGSAYANRNYTGNGTDKNYVWGAMLSEGALSDYIKTEGTTETKRVETFTDVPRLDWLNSNCPSLLLEPQSTNILTYSEDFSQPSWNKSNTSIQINTTTSPSGNFDGSTLTDNATSNVHRIREAVSLSASTDYSLSVFAKKDTLSNIQLALVNIANSNTISKVFDLENGIIGEELSQGGTTVSDAKIENFGNGWYRCTIVGQLGSTPNQYQISLATKTTGNSHTLSQVTYSGDGTGSVFLYGAQLEQQLYTTSYIKTEGSTVTRLADECNGSGNADLFNDAEGVLYAEISALADDNTYRVLSLSDGTTNERVYMQYTNASNTVSVVVKDGGVTQANMVYVLDDATKFSKVAIKYKANDFALWVNGVERGTDTSGNTPTGLNTLAFNSGGSAVFYGKVKDLRYYDTALTDAELTELTT